MATIEKRSNGQWRARWREYPGGPQRAKHFLRKVDAERWLTKVQHDLLAGTYVSTDAARTTLEAYYRAWLDRTAPTWRPNTVAKVRNSMERHVLPVLGGRPLTALRRSDVEALCASLPLAPGSVGIVAQHLGQCLHSAVEDGLIARNPAHRARLPRKEAAKAQPVPLEAVERIHAALPPGCGSSSRSGSAPGSGRVRSAA